MEEVEAKLLKEITTSNSYTIVERCQPIVRKLKRAKNLDEAMIFLMRVAHALADIGEWHPAVVAAKRSIDLFPTDATTIKTVLKRYFISFGERATPEAACCDLFTFYRTLSIIIGDENYKFLRKQAEIADISNNYLYAQTFYLEIIKKNVENPQSYSAEQISDAIKGLAQLLLRWISNIENKEQQKFTAPYIVVRCTLILMTFKDQGVIHSEKLFDIIMKLNPFTEDKIFEVPLITFLKLFIRAIKEKSLPTTKFLIKAYQPVLDLDTDLGKWYGKVQSLTFPSGLTPNVNDIFQNVFSNFFGNSMPRQ